MPAGRFTSDVFVNCPFDPHYLPMFEAIIFCVMDCGIRSRCALEVTICRRCAETSDWKSTN